MSEHIPTCGCWVATYGTRVEYCPLHAAAPEMLKALEGAAVALDRNTTYNILVGDGYVENFNDNGVIEVLAVVVAAIAKAKPEPAGTVTGLRVGTATKAKLSPGAVSPGKRLMGLKPGEGIIRMPSEVAPGFAGKAFRVVVEAAIPHRDGAIDGARTHICGYHIGGTIMGQPIDEDELLRVTEQPEPEGPEVGPTQGEWDRDAKAFNDCVNRLGEEQQEDES